MRVLLTGATGFVGRHLFPALVSAGWDVRSATRDVAAARKRHPDRQWVRLDVERPETLEPALQGCDAVCYLIHGMAGGADYPQREAQSAHDFVAAAEASGVSHMVYLGGVLPAGSRISKHLLSRQQTGEILRAGRVSTTELRAAMIMGSGSASWTMVRDLAARLPAMILPRWLRNHSHPIAIDDVVWGMLAALTRPAHGSRVFELPGPERISHREVLRRVAALMGNTRLMISVPILTPRLSSYWIALVTRVDLDLAKELVEGVRYDLDPREDTLWEHVPHQRMTIERAARLALEDARSGVVPAPAAIARAQKIGAQFAGGLP